MLVPNTTTVISVLAHAKAIASIKTFLFQKKTHKYTLPLTITVLCLGKARRAAPQIALFPQAFVLSEGQICTLIPDYAHQKSPTLQTPWLRIE